MVKLGNIGPQIDEIGHFKIIETGRWNWEKICYNIISVLSCTGSKMFLAFTFYILAITGHTGKVILPDSKAS
jgi:hypothetical protein